MISKAINNSVDMINEFEALIHLLDIFKSPYT